MFENLMSTVPYRVLIPFDREGEGGGGGGGDAFHQMQDGSVSGAAAALATLTLDDETDDGDSNDGQQGADDGQQRVQDDGNDGSEGDDDAQSDDGNDSTKAKTDDGEGDGEGEETDFFELPPQEEGGEPVRVAATEVWDGYQEAQTLREENTRLKERDGQIPEEVDTALKDTIAVRQQLAVSLQTWKDLQAPPKPDPSMLDQQSQNFDPQGYKEALDRSEAFAAAQSEAEKELAKQQEALQKEMDIRRQAAVGRADAEIKTFWPEFVNDPAVKKAAHQDMVKLFGATSEEMEQTFDPRFWAMAKSAIAFEKQQAKAKQNVKIVRGKPKLVKGQARDSNSAKRTSLANAMSDLTKDGSNEDAAVAALSVFDD